MVAEDEDLLICDLAEVYHIYNWREFPIDLIATLAFGLSDNSRIKRRLAGIPIPLETLMLAQAVDRLSILVWQATQDGHRGVNRPTMMTELLMGTTAEDGGGYDSPEEFWKAWNA